MRHHALCSLSWLDQCSFCLQLQNPEERPDALAVADALANSVDILTQADSPLERLPGSQAAQDHPPYDLMSEQQLEDALLQGNLPNTTAAVAPPVDVDEDPAGVHCIASSS
jgi:hypothetical protein